MLEWLEAMTSLFPYPLAVFQKTNCIFEREIDHIDNFHFLAKKLPLIHKPDTLIINDFRGSTFIFVKFLFQEEDYFLVLLVPKSETATWNKKDWKTLARKITGGVLILKNQSCLPFYNDPFPSTNKSKKNSIDPPTSVLHDFTDNYQLEKIFFNQMKSGDLPSLNKLAITMNKISQSDLSNDKLQDSKYRLVSLITLLTRTAIQYGCPSNLSYRLSDRLIKKTDELQKDADTKLILSTIINEFSVLIVNRSNRYGSPIVNEAISYIYRNLYERLSNKKIAQAISVNSSYLSSLFKATTKISLHHFIINARISEAKYLLNYSDLAYKEIGESLRFSNQSHFCKHFKEKTGFSPREFRSLF